MGLLLSHNIPVWRQQIIFLSICICIRKWFCYYKKYVVSLTIICNDITMLLNINITMPVRPITLKKQSMAIPNWWMISTEHSLEMVFFSVSICWRNHISNFYVNISIYCAEVFNYKYHQQGSSVRGKMKASMLDKNLNSSRWGVCVKISVIQMSFITWSF